MMMNRIMTAVAMVTLSMILLTGCGSKVEASEDRAPQAIALVIGNHLCSKELNLSSPLIMDTVADTIADYGFISVVNVDGSPSLIAADSYDIPDQYKNATATKLRSDAEAKARNLMMQISTVKADDAEVDTLEAIRIAVRSLASAPADAKRTIIVVDTGMSTTGLLNFGNNLLTADPAIIADMLAQKDAIPDLAHTTVMWQQLGDVAEPQKELSPAQVNTLEAIWRAIVEKGGGTFVCSATVPNNGIIGGELPEVSPIELQVEEPVVFSAETTTVTEDLFATPVVFTEKQIGFQGDSARYVDEASAEAVINPIAQYMLDNPGFRLVVCGTTAGDTDSQYVRDLSQARAATVVSSLIKFGVPEGNIIAIGLSNQDPWHISGAGTDGELAAQNRKVVMISAESAGEYGVEIGF